MKIETSTLILPVQPIETTFAQLKKFASEWNRNHAHQFSESLEMFIELRIPDSSHTDQAELSEAIKKLQDSLQVEVHISRQRVYDADDYAIADFIEINGTALDEEPGKPLVTNAHKILTPNPCPQCGYGDIFDQSQHGPFAINETLLDCLAADGIPPPPGGWDFVEADAGHKLVSSRFAAVLADHHVEGYTLEPVLVSHDGQPSKRIWQLRAIQTIICPCSEHTRAIDGYFCPTCGVAHCDVEDEDWLRDAWIGGNEIFSRHLNHGAIIYVSGRVYRLLVEASLQQINPSRIFRVCQC